MKPVRTHALKLRLKGFSINEITKKLGVPKSTLSGWLRGVVLSEKARTRIQSRVRQGVYNGLIKRNKLQTHIARQRVARIRNEGKELFPKLTESDLIVVGAVLYWAEGYKRPLFRNGKEITAHVISFVNSDPDMIRIFIRFLIEILHIPRDRINFSMRLYAHINENEALNYWSQVTGATKSCFKKTTYLVSGASKGKRPFNRLPYGTLQVSVNSTDKFSFLMGMIDGVKEKL